MINNRYVLGECLFSGNRLGELYRARDTQAVQQGTPSEVLLHFISSKELAYTKYREVCDALSELTFPGKLSSQILVVQDFGWTGEKGYFVLEMPEDWSLSALSPVSGEMTSLHQRADKMVAGLHAQKLVKKGLYPSVFLVASSGELFLLGTALNRTIQQLQPLSGLLVGAEHDSGGGRESSGRWLGWSLLAFSGFALAGGAYVNRAAIVEKFPVLFSQEAMFQVGPDELNVTTTKAVVAQVSEDITRSITPSTLVDKKIVVPVTAETSSSLTAPSPVVVADLGVSETETPTESDLTVRSDSGVDDFKVKSVSEMLADAGIVVDSPVAEEAEAGFAEGDLTDVEAAAVVIVEEAPKLAGIAADSDSVEKIELVESVDVAIETPKVEVLVGETELPEPVVAEPVEVMASLPDAGAMMGVDSSESLGLSEAVAAEVPASEAEIVAVEAPADPQNPESVIQLAQVMPQASSPESVSAVSVDSDNHAIEPQPVQSVAEIIEPEPVQPAKRHVPDIQDVRWNGMSGQNVLVRAESAWQEGRFQAALYFIRGLWRKGVRDDQLSGLVGKWVVADQQKAEALFASGEPDEARALLKQAAGLIKEFGLNELSDTQRVLENQLQ